MNARMIEIKERSSGLEPLGYVGNDG